MKPKQKAAQPRSDFRSTSYGVLRRGCLVWGSSHAWVWPRSKQISPSVPRKTPGASGISKYFMAVSMHSRLSAKEKHFPRPYCSPFRQVIACMSGVEETF